MQADLGTSVTLSCLVDGNPAPDITWIHHEKNKIVGSHSDLTLRVDVETAGRYYCKAHVPGFPEIGAEASIYLKGI